MNFEPRHQSLAVASGAVALPTPERQALGVVQDTAGFVNRGLAILWREVVASDLAGRYAEARAMIEADDLAGLGGLLHVCPDLLDFRPADPDGLQLLHVAARTGTTACLNLLVEQGASLESPSGHLQADAGGFHPGATPLLLAVERARTEAVAALLAAGADANAILPASHETALLLAVAEGMEPLVELLIDAGAELDIGSDRYSCDDHLGVYCVNSALHVAALNDRAEIVRMLLKAGADRDACGADQRTALHYAAAGGGVGALEVLLAAGADPNARDACELDGLTVERSPLHYAVLDGQPAAVTVLLCYGADPAAVEPASGENAWQMALHYEAPQLATLLARAQRGDLGEVFSRLDNQTIACSLAAYAELRAFLLNLLAESPGGNKSLLVLSDWLVETLGADHRPYLARAYRESLAGEAR